MALDPAGGAAARPGRPTGRRAPGRPRTRRLLGSLLLAGLPWSWFAVRDWRSFMDVVATGLPVVAAGLAGLALLVAAVARRPGPVAFGASVLAVATVAVVGPWLPDRRPAPAQPFRVVAANALAYNPEDQAAAADVAAEDGDLVVVVENALPVFLALEGRFGHEALSSGGEHAVLSHFAVRPLPEPGGLSRPDTVSRWEVAAPGGPVVLYAVHLARPRARQPFDVRRQLHRQRVDVRAILAAVRAERLPVLVVGDFNLSDRTWGYRLLNGEMTDAMRESRTGPTFVRPRYRPFLWRIDHIFVPSSWCSEASERFPITGSDHRGVAADVGPCP